MKALKFIARLAAFASLVYVLPFALIWADGQYREFYAAHAAEAEAPVAGLNLFLLEEFEERAELGLIEVFDPPQVIAIAPKTDALELVIGLADAGRLEWMPMSDENGELLGLFVRVLMDDGETIVYDAIVFAEDGADGVMVLRFGRQEIGRAS